MGPEVGEASGQEMWLRVLIFGNRAHMVLVTRKTFRGSGRGGVPTRGLAGPECSCSDIPEGSGQGTQHQRVLLQGGREPAQSEPGALPRLPRPGSPCQQQPGEATGSSWRGERQFWFLFSGQEGVPGQAASAVRSPAPSQTGEEEKLFS